MEAQVLRLLLDLIKALFRIIFGLMGDEEGGVTE